MTIRHSNWDQLLSGALAYADAGWPVFPLRPGSKRPATPNHTPETCDGSDHRCWNGHIGWEPRATVRLDRIARAWRQRAYGIGIACGPAGLIVIDLDVAKHHQPITGAETLAALEAEHDQRLPATWTIGTPSGGRHLYYQQPEGAQLRNMSGRLGPGIDTRGHGGYVVAPPTRTKHGDYWLIDDREPVELPGWFHALLMPPPQRPHRSGPVRRPAPLDNGDRLRRYVDRAVDGEVDRITTAREGGRNRAVYDASFALGQLVGADLLGRQEAEDLLESAASCHYGHPPPPGQPFNRREALQTIASGLRRGSAHPRRLPGDMAARQGAQ